MTVYRSVLVGTDGSATAARAVAKAAALAEACGATLLVATVADAERGAPVLEEVTAGLAGLEAPVRTQLLSGDPADALVTFAAQAQVDVIVVGNKGMAGAKRFLLGSVPNRVSHRAGCDVLIVHTVGPGHSDLLAD